MELVGNWNYPNAIRFGAGRILELPEQCRAVGMTRPLLITDSGLATHDIVQNALDICDKAALSAGMYSNVSGNPTGSEVDGGVDAYKAGGYDGIIAFGGGSGLDAAKAVALMVPQTRPIWDFEDVGDNWTRVNTKGLAPVVAVPTTSGTGSEVGRASVITDEALHVKKIIFHPRMLPAVALSDPELTIGLPAHLTAATGMDALSHCMEAFFSPFYHPMSRGIAVEGIRLVKQWLPDAVRDGGNIEARSHMMAASQAGATSFQKGLGAMHALAHSLGAVYNAHHGLLNAVLMPYVLQANRTAIEHEAEYLARCLGLRGFDGLYDWILTLRDETGIQATLADIGIDDAQAGLIGQMAVQDPSAAGNPVAFDEAQYAEIFRCAVSGADVAVEA